MSEHILHAIVFDGNGGGTKVGHEEISRHIKSQTLAWIHMDATHPATREWLTRETPYLDHLIIDALLAEETRPRMAQIDNGVLLILRGMNFNENAAPEDMVSIRLWANDHQIISLRKRRLKAVHDISEKLDVGTGPKNSGDFLCALSAQLFARMEPVLTDLDERTDDIEEVLLNEAATHLRAAIVGVRKQAIVFRRFIAPQRDAIGQLRMSDVNWLSDVHKRKLMEAHNHVTRYIEDLDAVRERAQIVKDELANVLSDKLNRNMYVLSVIAAIFLPLGFLTGLFGINLAGIPGAEYEYSFWVFSGILVAVVALQVYVFRRLKWF